MSNQDLETVALIISISAFLVSIITFIINYYRGRKTEQMKLSIEISSKLDEAENKIFEKEDESKKMIIDVQMKNAVERSLRDARLLYLNHWEFFSFLVNNDELKDEKILHYYKPNFKSGVKKIFEKLPDIRDDKEQCEEIKGLLKKWDPTYYSSHLEPNKT
jgi:hypothetical protein